MDITHEMVERLIAHASVAIGVTVITIILLKFVLDKKETIDDTPLDYDPLQSTRETIKLISQHLIVSIKEGAPVLSKGLGLSLVRHHDDYRRYHEIPKKLGGKELKKLRENPAVFYSNYNMAEWFDEIIRALEQQAKK